MKCWEYAGSVTATQQRRPCGRTATWEVLFDGIWRPVCWQHRENYYDLPQRKVG